MADELIQIGNAHVTITPYSMEFSPDTTFEEWEAVGDQIEKIDSSIQFYIGDWINFGSEKWERGRYEKVLEHVKYEPQTLRVYAYVTARFTQDFRKELLTRINNLPFTQLRILAKLPDPEVVEFLLRANEGNWSTRRLEEAVNKRHPKSIVDRLKGWFSRKDKYNGRPIIDRPIKGEGAYLLTGFKELPKLLEAPDET